MKVAFCHLDLGVGGAERFIVDAATELKNNGDDVHMYTSYYDPDRCFEETKLLHIRTVGSWIPRSIFGVATVLCAWWRMAAIALSVCSAIWTGKHQYDCIIIDQVSAIIPLLKLCTRSKVLFYGHFPDMLLASHTSRLRRIYRAPLDWFEGWTTAQADRLLFNSNFTRSVYAATFPRLRAAHPSVNVLYPSVAIPAAAQLVREQQGWKEGLEEDLVNWARAGDVFVSINRFERKKNIALAIRALSEVIKRHAFSSGACARCRLIVCGGYDVRVRENVAHLAELKDLADDLDVADRVVFLPNVTDQQRRWLVALARAVVYTPENEHFGIVPIEAMGSGRPVIACNSGGPLETVVHQKTGLLSEPVAMDFANAMVIMLMMSAAELSSMQKAARAHVEEKFSSKVFRMQWLTAIEDLTGAAKAQ